MAVLGSKMLKSSHFIPHKCEYAILNFTMVVLFEFPVLVEEWQCWLKIYFSLVRGRTHANSTKKQMSSSSI